MKILRRPLQIHRKKTFELDFRRKLTLNTTSNLTDYLVLKRETFEEKQSERQLRSPISHIAS